jgi:hypothetical protein
VSWWGVPHYFSPKNSTVCEYRLQDGTFHLERALSKQTVQSIIRRNYRHLVAVMHAPEEAARLAQPLL